MEKIYILLPVHNRCEITRKFIKWLKSQTYQNYHLVLIDDGCTDNTEVMVRSYIASLTVIKGRGNWWWAGSLHQGYLWLKSQQIDSDDLVLIINDDTEFEETFLSTAVSIMKSNEKNLLLSQCYSNQSKQLVDAGINIDWQNLQFHPATTQEEINCFSTRGLFIKWEDFTRIGGFYPTLLPHYGSDYEFTIRAFRRGIKPLVVPQLKIFIDESTTGYHQVESNSLNDFFKSIFSKRSAINPIYLSIFIILACPWKWKITNLLRIWKRTLFQAFSISPFFLKRLS